MERLTNGGWQIKLHYGATLSPPKENLDGLRAGLFDACHFCALYTPGKLPLHTVMELAFITPPDPLQISLLLAALWEHPELLKELERWNAVPLLPGTVLTYNIMGNVPIRKAEDFNGVRIRVGGEMARVLEQFGAVPTMVPAPELFETLERGTIDVAAFPWDACANFKLYEVSKYAIANLSLGTSFCSYVANNRSWDALPEEYKKIHKEWAKKAPQEWAKDANSVDTKWIPVFKEKLEWIEFAPEERAKLVAKAEVSWEAWVKTWEEKGLPASEILKYFLEKRKEICGY
jgi:TRAP-type C4-dicarboxylate transport system substrate-binding protein